MKYAILSSRNRLYKHNLLKVTDFVSPKIALVSVLMIFFLCSQKSNAPPAHGFEALVDL